LKKDKTQTDPLPSWHEGPTKESILRFVERVTTEGGVDFVPPLERIAVFDNDGILWIDEPLHMTATPTRLGRYGRKGGGMENSPDQGQTQ